MHYWDNFRTNALSDIYEICCIGRTIYLGKFKASVLLKLRLIVKLNLHRTIEFEGVVAYKRRLALRILSFDSDTIWRPLLISFLAARLKLSVICLSFARTESGILIKCP